MNTTFAPDTLRTLAPLAERIVSLDAATKFYNISSAEIEEKSRQAEGVKEQFQLVTEAQKRLNRATELHHEMTGLMSQAHDVARAAGKSLPGMDGLRRIAARYSASL